VIPGDYKNVQTDRPPGAAGLRQRPSYFLSGFALGLAVALSFYHLAGRQPAGGAASPPPAAAEKPAPTEQGREASPEPKFEFYSILPAKESQVPEWRIAPPPDEKSQPAPAPAGRYFLQAGSFRRPGEAEQLRARLGFLGLKADIQTVNLAEQGIWYRVKVGPFARIGELEQARGQLVRAGFRFIVLQQKEQDARGANPGP